MSAASKFLRLDKSPEKKHFLEDIRTWGYADV